MRENNKLHYALFKPDPESHCLYCSILTLEKVNGCKEIVSELTKKLEELFANVPEDKCVKKLDDLVYYENGLIERKGEYGRGVIASPWTSITAIKKPVKKPKKHLFKYLKYKFERTEYYYYTNRLGMILYYQMRLHNKSSMTYNKIKIDFVNFLKKSEAFMMLSEQERKLTGIHFSLEDVYEIFRQLRQLLSEGYYFSNTQCEDVMLIYDTFPDKDVERYWQTNELTESCDQYLNNNTLCRINKDFNKIYDYIKNLKKIDKLLYEKIISCSVEIYKELYDIKETNMRTLLIKLGIIEEGYMPSFSGLSEEEMKNEQ